MGVQYPKLRNMAHTVPLLTFSLLPKDQAFILYLLLLQLALCRVATLNISPYITYSADYIFSFGHLRSVRIFRELKIERLESSS